MTTDGMLTLASLPATTENMWSRSPVHKESVLLDTDGELYCRTEKTPGGAMRHAS